MPTLERFGQQETAGAAPAFTFTPSERDRDASGPRSGYDFAWNADVVAGLGFTFTVSRSFVVAVVGNAPAASPGRFSLADIVRQLSDGAVFRAPADMQEGLGRILAARETHFADDIVPWARRLGREAAELTD